MNPNIHIVSEREKRICILQDYNSPGMSWIFTSANGSMGGSVSFGRRWRCNSIYYMRGSVCVCVCVLFFYMRGCVCVSGFVCGVHWPNCNGYELHRWSYITHYLRTKFKWVATVCGFNVWCRTEKCFSVLVEHCSTKQQLVHRNHSVTIWNIIVKACFSGR